MSVTFINCFEVPAGRDDDFLAVFGRVNAYMRAKPGYESNRLHRSLAPDARYRFVNVVVWSSVQTWDDAHDDGFRALVAVPEFAGIVSTPALYEVAQEAVAAA